MFTFLRRIRLLAVTAVVMLAVGACSSGSSGGDDDSKDSALKVAAIFSGTINDGGFSQNGLLALESAKSELGADIAYSESVQVPDAENVMRQYVADGNKVIWAHGAQFWDAVQTVAAESPDVTFIGELDVKPDETAKNVWVLDRNFYTPFYVIGSLAGQVSKSGKIGFVGGLDLPFTNAEVNAMRQALKADGKDMTVTPVFVGDFNDPTKAQQLSSQLIERGNDVLVGSLDLGQAGLDNAAESKDGVSTTAVTAKTDEATDTSPALAARIVFDYGPPLVSLLGDVQDGTTTGYLKLDFTNGIAVEVTDAVDGAVKDQIGQLVEKIKSGEVTIENDQTAATK